MILDLYVILDYELIMSKSKDKSYIYCVII